MSSLASNKSGNKSSRCLFRVYKHDKSGYATINSDRYDTVIDLKREALTALTKKRKPSTTSKPPPKQPANDTTIETTPTESKPVATNTTTTTTNPTALSTTTIENNVHDIHGETKTASTSTSTSTTTSQSTPNTNTNDDIDPSMYFVRILSNHTTNLFKDVIQRCHLDDEALVLETKQWIMGAEDKTLVYSIHDAYKELMEVQNATKTTKKKASKRRSIFSRSTSEPSTSTTSSSTTSKTLSTSSSTSASASTCTSTPSHRKSSSTNTIQTTIAMIELIPIDIVPPNSTTMIMTIPTYFPAKDMFDKTFYKYRIKVSNGSLDWKVQRRFKQFVEMNDELTKLWNTTLTKAQQNNLRPLPKLPKKTFLLQKNTSLKFLSARRIKLEKYITLLKIHPWGSFQVPYLSFTGLLSNTRDEKEAEGRHVIHVSRLHEFVKVGDVVLFKSANLMSGLQRVATRSEWDHCGIVVKLRRSLYLLESTGDGVGCYPLTNRIRAYGVEFAQYMAVRRLIGPRSRNFISSLIEFTNLVNGTKYKLGFKKLMTSQTLEKSMSEKGGLFCSELVAAAWQEIKCMKNDKAPNSYWPTDFGENGKIDEALNDAFMLEPVVLIDTRVVEVARAEEHVYEEKSGGSNGGEEEENNKKTAVSAQAGRFGMGSWGT